MFELLHMARELIGRRRSVACGVVIVLVVLGLVVMVLLLVLLLRLDQLQR